MSNACSQISVRICGTLFAPLVLLGVVRLGEARAGEPMILAGDPLKPDFGAPWRPNPASAALPHLPTGFEALQLPEGRDFSSRDFRPRGRSILAEDCPVDALDQAPMLRGTTVWQRMSDYRSHDRVRLLTLWETGGSSVSLQTGKKGNPSLQWTSRRMNRGGATRGLLDRWFADSLAGVNHSMHNMARTGGTDAPAKPAKLLDGASSR